MERDVPPGRPLGEASGEAVSLARLADAAVGGVRTTSAEVYE
jgi:hypothetical protein